MFLDEALKFLEDLRSENVVCEGGNEPDDQIFEIGRTQFH
jgi:hypothetical protein